MCVNLSGVWGAILSSNYDCFILLAIDLTKFLFSCHRFCVDVLSHVFHFNDFIALCTGFYVAPVTDTNSVYIYADSPLCNAMCVVLLR